MKAVVPFAVLCVACSEGVNAADATVDAVSYPLTIGQAFADGGFAPAGDDASLEMFLGFQGFRYARVVLAARGDAPDRCRGRARFAIDGEETVEQVMGTVAFGPPVDGVRYTRPILVFSNDVVLEAVVGRHFTLSIDLSDPGHKAGASASGTLWWDRHCVDDGNGACLSPDGGIDGGAR